MKTLLVIDVDDSIRGQLGSWLGEQGWSLIHAPDARHGIELALEHKPEIVLYDSLSGNCNGSALSRGIRQYKDSQAAVMVIVAMGGENVSEKINALEAGADEYVVKPVPRQFLDGLLLRFDSAAGRGLAADGRLNGSAGAPGRTRIKFWGVRGSIPSPGPETVFYGGNTSCVEVRAGSDIIILDSGSGLRRLGLSLMEEFRSRPMQLSLLITHTHWDHIQGFPFFLPAYDPKNDLTIYGYEGASKGLHSTLSDQMESPYFPISMRQMPGHIAIHELHEMHFDVRGIPVRAQFLNHPGICAGYRLETPGGSVCYLPDVELHRSLRAIWNAEADTPASRPPAPPEQVRALIDFIAGSDVLILDSQFSADEYENHVGWGHSCVEDTVAHALQAGVKRLFLFHHDPDHTDEKVSRLVARARQIAARHGSNMIVEAAREGFELILSGQTQAKASVGGA